MKETTPTSSCPFLKEVVMLYCDACSVRKMLPLDHLVSTRPCLAESYEQCPMFQDALRRASFGTAAADIANGSGDPVAAGGTGKEASS